MPDARRQFRVLYRDFLARMVDLEALSAGGGIVNLLVQFAAVLAAFSFVVTISTVPYYGTSQLPREQLLIAAWSHEEFLIATTMAITGLFAVLAWNVIFPDRRDTYILGVLPVRTRTIGAAKAAAIGTALGVSVVAVNVFTGLSFPFVLPVDGTFLGALRCLAAYWLTMAAAGLFVCCVLLALQGIASQLFGYRLFLRVSSFLQLAAFFVILGVYFLTPPLATVSGLTAPENRGLLAALPQFWFLGLFQELSGSTHPVFGPLAARALWSLSIAAAVAAVAYTLAYRRNIRRIVEQPDIVPADRSRPATRILKFLAGRLLARPLERAIFLFTARTMARSRQHRLLLAVYGGIGLAIALAYAKSLINRSSEQRWDEPNRALLAGSLVLLFFAVIGARAVFALPMALPSNWVFRITAVHSPNSYFTAVRKTLFAIAAIPIWIGSAILYFTIWPGRPALEHLAVLVAAGILLIQLSLRKFRKIPFACSYLPGKGNLKIALGVYGALILFLTDVGIRIEFWTLERFARFVVLFSILLVAAMWARRRTAEFQASPYNRLQFEDLPPGELLALDLRRDGVWSGDGAYLGATDPRERRTLLQRLRSLAIIALVVVAAGFVYEQFGSWRDHQRFQQIGRSVDIGGRSLNIYCSGEGSPAVVLESGHSMPGYSWVFIQREIAKFTRACWYDRAGSGWSDPGRDPNWSDSIARDLHKLLRNARVPPPYVLVGHSMGGFTVRVYRGFYPGEVAGMVLVDSSHEGAVTWRETTPAYLLWLQKRAIQTLGRIGLVRLSQWDQGPPPRGMTPRECATVSSLVWQIKSQLAQVYERPLIESAQQAHAAGGLGDVPLIVLTAGRPSEGGTTAEQRAWIDLQAGLTRLSTRGRQEVVYDSGHMIPFEAPEAVIDAVRGVVAEARATGTSSR